MGEKIQIPAFCKLLPIMKYCEIMAMNIIITIHQIYLHFVQLFLNLNFTLLQQFFTPIIVIIHFITIFMALNRLLLLLKWMQSQLNLLTNHFITLHLLIHHFSLPLIRLKL